MSKAKDWQEEYGDDDEDGGITDEELNGAIEVLANHVIQQKSSMFEGEFAVARGGDPELGLTKFIVIVARGPAREVFEDFVETLHRNGHLAPIDDGEGGDDDDNIEWN